MINFIMEKLLTVQCREGWIYLLFYNNLVNRCVLIGRELWSMRV